MSKKVKKWKISRKGFNPGEKEKKLKNRKKKLNKREKLDNPVYCVVVDITKERSDSKGGSNHLKT